MNNKRAKNARPTRFKKRNGRSSGNLARTKDQSLKKIDQFNSLARDARQNQDIVQYEYYMQHVDHFTRIVDEITESTPAPQHNEPQRTESQQTDSHPDAQVIEIETSESDNNVKSAETKATTSDETEIEVVPEKPKSAPRKRASPKPRTKPKTSKTDEDTPTE